MVSYVVDTSVIMHSLIEDRYSKQADALLALPLNTDTQLIVPEFCIAECVNVVWKQVRLFGMERELGDSLLDKIEDLPVDVLLFQPYLRDAYTIGLKHNLAIYDSIYIAIARDMNCPLITVDARQATAAQAEKIALTPITEFAPP
jgi:predicted nucleic acid-binding protein